MTDIPGAGELGDALKKSGSPVLSTVGSTIGGAVAGLAVGETVALALPFAAAGVAVAASAAGATAATTLGIMGTGMAIGSSIPIPGIGTLIGAIAGAIAAVIAWFNNRPPPAVCKELLNVFRCFPNVLREWIDNRETFGLPHDNSALRSRWGYISMLREEAGEKGYDPFDDEAWRAKFEAGQVEVKCKTSPNFKTLGIHVSKAEAEKAAVDLRVLLASVPATITVGVGKVRGSYALFVDASANIPPEAEGKIPWVQPRAYLFVFKRSRQSAMANIIAPENVVYVPIIYKPKPPTVKRVTSEAQLAADSLSSRYKGELWFNGAKIVAESSGYQTRYVIEVDATYLPKGVTAADLSSDAGYPVRVSVDSSWIWVLSAFSALALGGAYYANRRRP